MTNATYSSSKLTMYCCDKLISATTNFKNKKKKKNCLLRKIDELTLKPVTLFIAPYLSHKLTCVSYL